MLKIAVIGLGRQALDNHIPAILESEKFDLVAVCDINPASAKAVSEKFKIKGFTSVDELIGSTKCDAAIVVVPHNQCVPIITKLANASINIIKETIRNNHRRNLCYSQSCKWQSLSWCDITTSLQSDLPDFFADATTHRKNLLY